MNSYRQFLFHIVFCTYERKNTLPVEHHEELYKYLWGVIKNHKGVLYRINGVENHVHILCDLNPTVLMSDLIKDLKVGSNKWMKQTGNFTKFDSWAEGYFAATYSYKDKNTIINYINNQKEHHKTINFEDEYRALLKEHGIEWDEKYIF